MKNDIKIVYMGTPEFAVPGLRKLVAHGYRVVAVVTTPDKPAGRGLRMQSSPLKKAAMDLEIPVLTPQSLRSDDFYDQLCQLKPDLQIVVAFKKLPARIWQLPPLGTFNLHASLLPQYRGAAPINWAIINGENLTGLTTFFINDKIDEGKILLQTCIPIDEKMTAGQLHDAMLEPGADLILQTVDGILNQTLTPKEQPLTPTLRPAPKIFREDCQINWNKDVTEVFNFIRGLSPYPGAFTYFRLAGKTMVVKILETEKNSGNQSLKPGELTIFPKHQMCIGCQGGSLKILKLIPEGKKPMSAEEFLNGYSNKGDLIKIKQSVVD
ncbi:methionyl-tRNA formyltransferase [Schleiferia thermophila]|jgi:methionyl-tRNA formyltransferase|uniref:methionyl-tRNA formyltransferase n=1 Tax=Schleiferia thermophila TaxID=884107 RepID=UPI0004E713C5|nr:methionyl-tRNA formyltransferase [Schleiferia thermophila]KFD40065.1 methionyl-tRNA formyltransferase [Schleiferia thermophila str. Yellowstone]